MTTSSPGSTAASMAAIMASLAPHETVISVSGSTPRPHAADCFLATADRSCGAPHVVAYWLYPSRSAAAAASRIRGSVWKSGKPCAKLTARSGPFRARFKRVISRMTDSVKLWAFSERRSVARIRALQVADGDDVRAHDVARDFSLLRKDIDLGDDAGHMPVASDHRRAGDALRRQRRRDLLQRRVLAERDHVSRHHVFDWNHGWVSSVATVSRLALPPVKTRPVRPRPSFPEA